MVARGQNRGRRMTGAFMQMFNPVAVKAAVCAVAILGVGYWVFVQGSQNVEAHKGVRAAEGIEQTSEKAEDMTAAADAVSGLIEDTALGLSPDSPSTAGLTPTARDGPASVETETWYVRRVENLVNRWGPRYAAAIDDIIKFEHRFETTEDRLEEYFREQSRLTESVNDLNLRAELLSRDLEEREAYARWMEEGRDLLTRARAMRVGLDDMDAVIRKQQLTVNMLNEYGRANTIPNSVKSLHVSLADFRRQSDELAEDLSEQIFSQ